MLARRKVKEGRLPGAFGHLGAAGAASFSDEITSEIEVRQWLVCPYFQRSIEILGAARDAGRDPSFHSPMPPAATSGLARDDSAPRAPSILIDPSGPTVAALLPRFEAFIRVGEVTEKHVHNVVGGVRKAAAAMDWCWPAQITAASTIEYLEARRVKGNGPKFRNDIRGYISQFCSWCGRSQFPAGNPMDEVPRARVKRRRVRYVPTEGEVVRLIVAAASDWRKGDRWLVYLLAASTGLRMRTLKLLRVEHLRIEGLGPGGLAWLELPADIIKNGEASHVWLTRECAERIDQHLKCGGGLPVEVAGKPAGRLLFSKVPTPKHFDRDIARAGLAKKAAPGAPTFARHSLRHFYATRMAAHARFTLAERAEQLTHRSDRMTSEIYTDENHEMFGRRIWATQPLLPSEFGGNRGRRKGGTGPRNPTKCGKFPLTPGGDRVEDVAATSSFPNGTDAANPESTRRTPPGAHERRAEVAFCLTSVPRGVLPADSQCDPEPPDRSNLTPERGDRFKSCHPDLVGNDPDFVGALSEVMDAQAGLLAAQARLIRLLRKEQTDVSVSGPASSSSTT